MAIDGNYKKDSFFGLPSRKVSTDVNHNDRRLRALVQDAYRQFSYAIRRHGAAYEVTETPTEWDASDSDGDLLGLLDTTLRPPYSNFASEQQKISFETYVNYVQDLEKYFRGAQLSGMFNPDIVDELFRKHSSR